MPLVILRISNPMIRKALLPDLNPLHFPKPIRIPSLKKLHSPLQRDFDCGREQHMKVIRHNHKLVQQIFPLITIPEQYLDQELRPKFDTEDGQALPSDGCHEERALRVIHSQIVGPHRGRRL